MAPRIFDIVNSSAGLLSSHACFWVQGFRSHHTMAAARDEAAPVVEPRDDGDAPDLASDDGSETCRAFSEMTVSSSEAEEGTSLWEWAAVRMGPRGMMMPLKSIDFKPVSEHWHKRASKGKPIRINVVGKEGSSYGYARDGEVQSRGGQLQALWRPVACSPRTLLPCVMLRTYGASLVVSFDFTLSEDGKSALVQWKHAMTGSHVRAMIMDTSEKVTLRGALDLLKRQLVVADSLSPQCKVKVPDLYMAYHQVMPWCKDVKGKQNRPRTMFTKSGKGSGSSSSGIDGKGGKGAVQKHQVVKK